MSNSVLIYGGSGALGKKCVEIFKLNNFKVVSVDLKANEMADFNISVDSTLNLVEQNDFVHQSILKLNLQHKFNVILCVAGGWAGGSANDANMINNVYLMEKQCLWSSVISAHLAAHFLTENGFLILTGANAALMPTPGMLGYGMIKAAVHQLTKSLAEDSTLPNGTWVAAILPITLDTEANRHNMPTADFTTWTPLTYVVNLLLEWINGDKVKPISGSLVQIITTNNETTTTIV